MTQEQQIEKIRTMMAIQNETNQHVNPNWCDAGYDFLLAARMEAAEAIDHLGYKWWVKNFEPNMPQAQMELVDIWHFLLSDLLLKPSEQREAVLSEFDFSSCNMQPVEAVKALMTANAKDMPKAFSRACGALELSFDTLHRKFVGKAALNRLRWANQYGAGYQKVWQDGREDNEHLTDLLNGLPENEIEVTHIAKLLQERYNSNTSLAKD